MVPAETYFKKIFGYTPPRIVRAPGRLELLGNHTDYNEGLVMSLAIDRYIDIAIAPRKDGMIEVVSSNLPGHEKFSVSRIEKNPEIPWADYVKGVIVQLQKRKVPMSGFQAAIVGTIPPGAGLSSSAAVEVATALAIREVVPYSLTETGTTSPPERNAKGELPPMTAAERLNIARLCHAAEREFVGVNCGLLDQISSLFGKAFHAVSIDCRFQNVEQIPVIGAIAVVVCQSGVHHALVEGGYNQLRAYCESAAQKLGAHSLRSVDITTLLAEKGKLSQREYECAYHVVTEIQRVVYGERALREDDFIQFGQYMYQSHESSRDYFKNSCPELDILVELARTHPACLGARLTGGGFGGATINLIRRDEIQPFMSHMKEGYQNKTGIKMDPILCQIIDGAGTVR